MRIKVYDPVDETVCCPVTKQRIYNDDGELQPTTAMVCSIAWEAPDTPIFYDRRFEKIYNDTQKMVCESVRKRNPDEEEPDLDLYAVLKELPTRYIGLELHEYGMACGPVEGIFFCVFDKEARPKPLKRRTKNAAKKGKPQK